MVIKRMCGESTGKPANPGLTGMMVAKQRVCKVKVNVNLYRRENLTSNALRCGSHSVTCQSHHTCIYL